MNSQHRNVRRGRARQRKREADDHQESSPSPQVIAPACQPEAHPTDQPEAHPTDPPEAHPVYQLEAHPVYQLEAHPACHPALPILQIGCIFTAEVQYLGVNVWADTIDPNGWSKGVFDVTAGRGVWYYAPLGGGIYLIHDLVDGDGWGEICVCPKCRSDRRNPPLFRPYP